MVAQSIAMLLDDSLDVDEIDFTSLELMREARTEDGKYIDILIRHDESRVQQVDFFYQEFLSHLKKIE